MFFSPSKFDRQFQPHLTKILKPDTRYQATLHTEVGPLTIELFVEDAPNHVANFVQLTQKGAFNNVRFYRVVDKFVAQTGVTDERPLKPLKAEINHHDHTFGKISMAHGDDIDGAKGTFYICLGTLPSLDGEYTIFGELLHGQEVLDQLKRGSTLAIDREYHKADFQGTLVQKVTIQTIRPE